MDTSHITATSALNSEILSERAAFNARVSAEDKVLTVSAQERRAALANEWDQAREKLAEEIRGKMDDLAAKRTALQSLKKYRGVKRKRVKVEDEDEDAG